MIQRPCFEVVQVRRSLRCNSRTLLCWAGLCLDGPWYVRPKIKDSEVSWIFLFGSTSRWAEDSTPKWNNLQLDFQYAQYLSIVCQFFAHVRSALRQTAGPHPQPYRLVGSRAWWTGTLDQKVKLLRLHCTYRPSKTYHHMLKSTGWTSLVQFCVWIKVAKSQKWHAVQSSRTTTSVTLKRFRLIQSTSPLFWRVNDHHTTIYYP